jgi:hypothetical protein
MLSAAIPQWLQSIQDSSASDLLAKELISKLSIQGDSVPNFALKDGLLRYNSRLWVVSRSCTPGTDCRWLRPNKFGYDPVPPVEK